MSILRNNYPFVRQGNLIDYPVLGCVLGRQINCVGRVVSPLLQHSAKAARQVGIDEELAISPAVGPVVTVTKAEALCA